MNFLDNLRLLEYQQVLSLYAQLFVLAVAQFSTTLPTSAVLVEPGHHICRSTKALVAGVNDKGWGLLINCKEVNILFWCLQQQE